MCHDSEPSRNAREGDGKELAGKTLPFPDSIGKEHKLNHAEGGGQELGPHVDRVEKDKRSGSDQD
jgi:hypothetical protein